MMNRHAESKYAADKLASWYSWCHPCAGACVASWQLDNIYILVVRGPGRRSVQGEAGHLTINLIPTTR